MVVLIGHVNFVSVTSSPCFTGKPTLVYLQSFIRSAWLWILRLVSYVLTLYCIGSKELVEYTKATAPEKYHKWLVPDYRTYSAITLVEEYLM
jgi:hypothetical protein